MPAILFGPTIAGPLIILGVGYLLLFVTSSKRRFLRFLTVMSAIAVFSSAYFIYPLIFWDPHKRLEQARAIILDPDETPGGNCVAADLITKVLGKLPDEIEAYELRAFASVNCDCKYLPSALDDLDKAHLRLGDVQFYASRGKLEEKCDDPGAAALDYQESEELANHPSPTGGKGKQ
jgi:hypothetical protein